MMEDMGFGMVISLRDAFTANAGRITNSMHGLDATATRTQQSLERSMARIQTGGMMMGAGLAIAAIPSALVGATIKTENALGALASEGVKNFGVIRDAAINFSNNSTLSASEFVEGIYDVKGAIASLTDDGATKFMEAVAKTAAATLGNAKDMAKTFTTIYAAMFADTEGKIPAEEIAARTSGALATMVSMFRVRGPQVDAAVAALGKTGTMAGFSFIDQLATIGQLSSTMAGEVAGTAFRAFAEKIPSAEKGLGVGLTDLRGRALPVITILERIKNKYGDIGRKEVRLIMQDNFGVEGMKVIDLANQTDQLRTKQKALTDGMNQGLGPALSMAALIGEPLGRQLEQLHNKFSNLCEMLGDGLLPIVTPVIKILHGVVMALQTVARYVPFASVVLGGLALAISGVLVVGGSLVTLCGMIGLAVPLVVTGWNMLRAAVTGLIAPETAQVALMTAQTAAMEANTVAASADAAAQFLLADASEAANVALAARIAAPTLAAQVPASVYSDGVVTATSVAPALAANAIAAEQAAVASAARAGTAVAVQAEEAAARGVAAGTLAASTTAASWAGIGSKIRLLASPMALLTAGLTKLRAAAMFLVGGIGSVVRLAVVGITAVIGAISWPVIAVGAAIIGVGALIYASWRYNFGGMADAVTGFFGRIRDVVQGVKSLITSLTGHTGQIPTDLKNRLEAAGLMGVVTAFFKIYYRMQRVWEGFSSVIKGVWDDMGYIFGPFFEDLGTSLRELVSAVFSVGNAFGVVKVSTPSSEFLALGKAIGTVVKYLVYMATGVTLAVVSLVIAAVKVETFAAKAMQFLGIIDAFKLFGQAIYYLIVVPLGLLKDTFADLFSSFGWFYDAGASLLQTFASGITAGAKWVYDAMVSALTWVRNLLPFSDAKEGPLSDLTASGAALLRAFANGILSVIGLPAQIVGMALGAVADVASWAWSGIKAGASGLWEGIAAGSTVLVDAFASAFGKVASIASTTWESVKSGMSGLWEGTKETASGAWEGAKNVAGGLWDGVKNIGGSIWGGAKNVGVAATTALAGIAPAATVSTPPQAPVALYQTQQPVAGMSANLALQPQVPAVPDIGASLILAPQIAGTIPEQSTAPATQQGIQGQATSNPITTQQIGLVQNRQATQTIPLVPVGGAAASQTGQLSESDSLLQAILSKLDDLAQRPIDVSVTSTLDGRQIAKSVYADMRLQQVRNYQMR